VLSSSLRNITGTILLDLKNAAGAKMRIQLKGLQASDLAALNESYS
jgi:hypothetical protein